MDDLLHGLNPGHMPHNLLNGGHCNIHMPDDFLSVEHFLDPLNRLDVRAWDMDNLFDGLDPRPVPDDFLNMRNWHLNVPDDLLGVKHFLDPLHRLELRHM